MHARSSMDTQGFNQQSVPPGREDSPQFTNFRSAPDSQSHVSKSSTMPIGFNSNKNAVTADAPFDDFDGGSAQMMMED